MERARRRRAIARSVGEANFIPMGTGTSGTTRATETAGTMVATERAEAPVTTAVQQYASATGTSRTAEDPEDLANEYLEAYDGSRIMFGDPGSDKHKKKRREDRRRNFTDDVGAEAAAGGGGGGPGGRAPMDTGGEGGGDDSGDEGFMRWEEEQIRKGAGARSAAAARPKRAAPRQSGTPGTSEPRANRTAVVDSNAAPRTKVISFPLTYAHTCTTGSDAPSVPVGR